MSALGETWALDLMGFRIFLNSIGKKGALMPRPERSEYHYPFLSILIGFAEHGVSARAVARLSDELDVPIHPSLVKLNEQAIQFMDVFRYEFYDCGSAGGSGCAEVRISWSPKSRCGVAYFIDRENQDCDIVTSFEFKNDPALRKVVQKVIDYCANQWGIRNGLSAIVNCVPGLCDYELLRSKILKGEWFKAEVGEGATFDESRLLYLYSEEPDAQTRQKHLSRLHTAAFWGRIDLVQDLLSKGASINRKDAEGRTALHWAAACGYVELVKLLLANGAKPDERDSYYETPSQIAKGKHRLAVWDFLRRMPVEKK